MGSYMKSSLHIKYTLKTEPGYDTWKSNSVWKQWLELRHEGREALGGPDGKNSLVRIKGMGWEGGKCTAGKIESRGVWTLVEEMCVLHEADRESQWGLFCLPQALGVPSVARPPVMPLFFVGSWNPSPSCRVNCRTSEFLTCPWEQKSGPSYVPVHSDSASMISPLWTPVTCPDQIEAFFWILQRIMLPAIQSRNICSQIFIFKAMSFFFKLIFLQFYINSSL